MTKTLLATAFFLSALTAFAAPTTPPTCTSARQAKADVTVRRLYWQQTQGNYKLKEDVVCKTSVNLSIVPGPMAGCIYPILADCPITIDGEAHRITVSGSIYHNDDLGAPTKHFTASYHLDRNNDAGSSDVSTLDLGLKNINIGVQSQLDGPPAGKPTRDAVLVIVNYGEPDAP